MRLPNRLATGFILLTILAWPGLAQEPPDRPPVLENQAEPELVVPSGTTISIVLTTYLNTKGAQKGDLFYADCIYPIWIQQRLVIPKGSTIKGIVTDVVRPGKIKGKGRIAVRFESVLLPNGVLRDLVADFRGIHGRGDEKLDRKSETVEQEGTKGQDAGTVIGYGSQGAIIGAIVDRSARGAGIGAGAGAAVGLATILLSRGRDLIIEPGTQFDIELKQPLKFAYGELDFTNAQLNSAERAFTPRGDRGGNQRPPSYLPRLPGRIRPIWP